MTANAVSLWLDDVNCIVRGRHGWFLANRFDHYIGAALIRYGEYSECEHRFLQSLLRPGDFVVEVGANIGAHTVGLAKTVGENGQIIAIEAQPAVFRVLCANLALNDLRNVVPFAVGCGRIVETMTVPIYDPQAGIHNSGGVSLAREAPGVPVTVLPLDDLLEDIPRVDLLKIDVEGMELEVLQGAAKLIAKHRPRLYLENDRVDRSANLVRWIIDAGYRLWWHMPALFNEDNYFAISANDYPKIASFNMYCQPEAETRLPAGELVEVTDIEFHPLARRST